MSRARAVLLLATLAAGCGDGDPPAADAPSSPARPADRYGGPIHPGDAAGPAWADGHDLRSVQIAVLLDPMAPGASIQSTLAVRRAPGAPSRFVCRLDPPSRVERVLVTGVEASFDHAGSTLSVELPAERLADPEVQLIVFQTWPASGPQGLLPAHVAWHPRRGREDTFQGGLGVLAPPEVDVLAAGLELEARPSGGAWLERRSLLASPAHAMWLAWGPPRTAPVAVGGISVTALAPSAGRLDAVAGDLGRLAALFGELPGATLAVVEAPLGGAAGAAAPGLLVLDPARATPAGIAHLLAHAWWDRSGFEGDEVLCLAGEVACGHAPAEGERGELARRVALGGPGLTESLDRYQRGDRSLESLRQALSR